MTQANPDGICLYDLFMYQYKCIYSSVAFR